MTGINTTFLPISRFLFHSYLLLFFERMDVFRLADLDTFLLEKVITKVFIYLFLLSYEIFQLEGKSYFRLQQTCREMKEFIRKNRNISVYVDDIVFLELIGSSCQFHSTGSTMKWRAKKLFDMEGLYGTRLRGLHTPGGFDGLFPDEAANECEPLCDALKKNRITCDYLDIEKSEFTTEECVTLLDIVKPAHVELYSYESKRFEAVLQSKTLASWFLYIYFIF